MTILKLNCIQSITIWTKTFAALRTWSSFSHYKQFQFTNKICGRMKAFIQEAFIYNPQLTTHIYSSKNFLSIMLSMSDKLNENSWGIDVCECPSLE